MTQLQIQELFSVAPSTLKEWKNDTTKIINQPP